MQIYIAVNKNSINGAAVDLAGCTLAVYDWLLHNSLSLNPDKSEAAMFGTAQRVQSLREDMKATVAGTPIELSEHIKSLGVTLDQHFTFDSHVSNVCKAAYFHIRGLRHVRSAMSRETANTVACAIVGSRLDYCNSLLEGLSSKNPDKLQPSPKHACPTCHWKTKA